MFEILTPQGPLDIQKSMKNLDNPRLCYVFQGSSLFNISRLLLTFLTNFWQKAIHFGSREVPKGLYWDPQATLGSLLGVFFVPLDPSGDPLGPVLGPLGATFINFRTPLASKDGFYSIFESIFCKKSIDFQDDIDRFHHIHVYQIKQASK